MNLEGLVSLHLFVCFFLRVRSRGVLLPLATVVFNNFSYYKMKVQVIV